MRKRLRFVLLALASMALSVRPLWCQSGESKVPEVLEQWLRGPERHDFPMKVWVPPIGLTFQQRRVVQVRGTLPHSALQHDGTPRHIHVLLKVQEEGRWLPGYSYDELALPSNLDSISEVQFTMVFYARAGRYPAAVIAYDSAHNEASLWRGVVQVPSLKNDPLPQLDRELPAVEFLSDIPRDALSVSPSRLQFATALWPPAHGREWLPLSTARPVRIEVVLNLSEWVDPLMRGKSSGRGTRADLGRLMQIASVLSHLGMTDGCIRVSGLDPSRMQVMFDRVDGHKLEWDKVYAAANKVDRNTVDLRTLEARKQSAAFFRYQLLRLVHDPTGCGLSGEDPLRVMIVVSRDFLFPAGTIVSPVGPGDGGDCRFYYLRADNGLPVVDDIEKILKPVKPRRFSVRDPLQFRRVLAKMISEIEAASREQERPHLQ